MSKVMQHVLVHLSYDKHFKESHRQDASKHFEKFEYNNCDFSAKSNGVLKHREHIMHTKNTLTVTCELCDYRTSNAQYMKSHMQA